MMSANGSSEEQSCASTLPLAIQKPNVEQRYPALLSRGHEVKVRGNEMILNQSLAKSPIRPEGFLSDRSTVRIKKQGDTDAALRKLDDFFATNIPAIFEFLQLD